MRVLPSDWALTKNCKSIQIFREKNLFFSTVWKFQVFSVVQILCEINIGNTRSCETAFFAIFEALNFVNLVDFSLQKVQKLIKIKIQSL